MTNCELRIEAEDEQSNHINGHNRQEDNFRQAAPLGGRPENNHHLLDNHHVPNNQVLGNQDPGDLNQVMVEFERRYPDIDYKKMGKTSLVNRLL